MAQNDIDTIKQFDETLTWMLETSRNKTGRVEWLNALLVLSFRALYCKAEKRRSYWPTRVERDTNSGIWRFIANFYATIEPVGHPLAAQTLVGMAFGVGDETANAWLPYLEQFDLRGDQHGLRLFGRWLSDQFDDIEAWNRAGGNMMVTPPELSRVLLELADGAPGKTILNPACGVGGLLVAAAELFSPPGEMGASLSAFDRNGNLSAIAQLRMHLLDISVEGWVTETSKRLWHAEPAPADVIVSVPPAGALYNRAEFSLAERWRSFPALLQAELVIAMMTLDRMSASGRAALLVPKGFLFRGGDFARLRRIMIDEGTVSAVITLPAGLLAPITHIETAILVLANQERPDAPIVMADAREIGLRKRRRVTLTSHDVETIVKAVRQGSSDSAKVIIRSITNKEVEEAGFDLQPGRYLNSRTPDDRRTLDERYSVLRDMDSEYRSLAATADALIDELMSDE